MLVARFVHGWAGRALTPFIEWQSTANLAFVAYAIGPDAQHTFSSDKDLHVMASFADESTWSGGLFILVGIRLFALLVNRRIWWLRQICPALRSASALLAAFCWTAIFLGVYEASAHPITLGMLAVAGLSDLFAGLIIAGEAGELSASMRHAGP